jgi:hypothetical protein
MPYEFIIFLVHLTYILHPVLFGLIIQIFREDKSRKNFIMQFPHLNLSSSKYSVTLGGHAVAYLVESVWYKQKGRGFVFRRDY